MLTALECLPATEAAHRIARCRALMPSHAPEAGGMLVTSRIHLYYLTGTLAAGLAWLPLEGEPVLLVRKGLERAKLESPWQNIVPFTSYKELAPLCATLGSPLAACIAADKQQLSWSMAELLQARLPGTRFVSCDAVLSRARAVKSAWELNTLRLCGKRHQHALDVVLPERIHAGMSELEIAHVSNAVFAECGSQGMVRMSAHGEEFHVGYVSAGESGLYPTYFNGPMGCRGVHPSVPFMGDAGTIWQSKMVLSTDLGFSVGGYTTDRTQLYWSGTLDSIPKAFRQAQDTCIRIFEQAVASLKAGVLPSDIWREACALAAQSGQEAGFMNLGLNKVSFLGHGIGLCVDEFPVLAKGFDEPLEVGMVLAVEPKIGVAGLGMAGLEHTLEITEQGARSLTGTQMECIPIV